MDAMEWTLAKLSAWCSGERGQTLTEYGLVLLLASVALVGALAAFQADLVDFFAKIDAVLSSSF